ncbi:MAG: nitroreductase/quinone reductase family protein [Thaumarchaeota archaeon]|nr:nitroreductase/quinone reductase family protein [Nitrososphaerota archaeon]
MSSQGEHIRLETKGRRSGKAHSVLLRFLTYDGGIVVFPVNDSRQDWVANILANPEVRVYGEGKIIEGKASVKRVRSVSDPLLGAFTRKYGNDVVRSRYWGQMDYVEIRPTSNGISSSYDELVYGDLEAAFDGVAEEYDKHIFGNPVNVWLRNRSLELLGKVFRLGDTILEIGCGTGTETLALARKGVRVLASDISSKMLRVLQRKARAAGLEKLVVPVHSRPYELREKLAELGYRSVDGAYSTYGAINTEPRLRDLFRGLHSLLLPKGKLILGVWNRYCMYEILGYTVKLNPSMASARFNNPVPVGKSRFCVASNAYSVGELSEIIAPYFRFEKAYGVGIFLPPSNLTNYLPREPVLGLVKRMDVALESHFPWNRLGDHFLAVYSRLG